MTEFVALDGNLAAAYGVKLAQVQVIAAYPITPQTPIVEKIAQFIAGGELMARYINVESEHSALCAAVGAAAVGTRVFTASASAGLALMHEITGVAAGSRFPLVMAVVNRALPSPWSLWCDHSDIMGERDQGWIHLHAQSPQEVLDLILISYRIAEDSRVLLPVMVSIDGFYLSHLTEPVAVPEQEKVNDFLPDYQAKNYLLDPAEPLAINPLTSPQIFTEIKYQHQLAMDNTLPVMREVFASFYSQFKRKYSPLETYYLEDADYALVTMGSMSGTARYTVEKLREKGIRVGLLRIVSFRPFPLQGVKDVLSSVAGIAVIDRSTSMGSRGPLFLEVQSALAGNTTKGCVYSFIAGLGGRDITPETVEKVVEITIENTEKNTNNFRSIWVDLKDQESV